MTYAEYLKNLRTSKNLSQVELSKILDTSKSLIGEIENSNIKVPTLSVIKKISVAFNIQQLDILNEIGYFKSFFCNNSYSHHCDVLSKYCNYLFVEKYSIYPVFKDTDITFDIFAINKNNSKIKILVDVWNSSNINNMTLSMNISKVLSITKNISNYEILFDSTNLEHIAAFESFADYKLNNKTKFSVKLVLFDPTTLKVITSLCL